MTVDRFGVLESEIPSFESPHVNIWTYLAPFFRKWSPLTGVVCGETHTSYTIGQMYEASLRWGHELAACCSPDVDLRVAIVSPNRAEYPILYLGCLAVGGYLCPIPYDADADRMRELLVASNPHVVILDSSVLALCRNALNDVNLNPSIYVLGAKTEEKDKSVVDIILSDAKMLDLERAKEVSPDSIAMVAYTSGTTGKPKGILISHKGLIAQAACFMHPSVSAIRPADETFQDAVLMTLPLDDVYGLNFATLVSVIRGCKTVVANPRDFSKILDVMEETKPRVLNVHSLAIDILSQMNLFGSSFDNVQVLMNVGSSHNPLSMKTLKEKLNKNLLIQEWYGSSENGFALTTPVKYLGSHPLAFKPLPNTRVRFLDLDTGNPILEPNKPGELQLQIPRFMIGFLGDYKSAPLKSSTLDWIKTEDVGVFGEDGFVRVIDRVQDMIDVGTKKVFPSEIENVIKSHGSVLNAGVVGVVNPTTGWEEPKAFVVLSAPLKETELAKFVEENVPYPEMRLTGGVVCVQSLPRNYLGKLVRKDLQNLKPCQAQPVTMATDG